MMIVAFFLGYYLFSNNNDQANAGVQREKRVKVVVVQSQIELGTPISDGVVGYQRMPASSLPQDVVKEMHLVVGKFSRIPLPVGAPIGASLLSDEPISADSGESEQALPVDPIQQRLEAIYPNTVAVTLPFLTVPPVRGSRIAISIQGDAGRSVLVLEEAWVEKVEGNFAQIRVPSHMALYLEEAKALGVFSSLIIPLEGESPFAGQAVKDIVELRDKLTGKFPASEVAKQENPDEKAAVEDFSSYAWIRGHDRVYAIDAAGRMHTIDQKGKVAPLHPYKRQAPVAQGRVSEGFRIDMGVGNTNGAGSR